MLNRELHKLAESLNLTDYKDAEPYILTPEEEQRAIGYAIEQAQKFMAWKMRRLLKTEDEIWHKISLVNWKEKIDVRQVLKTANMIKNQEVWQREQRRKEKEQFANSQRELQQFWTYARVYKLMKFNSRHLFGKPLKETPDNLPVIKALCFFVSRDDRFNSELGFDRRKGLLIRGPSGAGKTHLVRCVEDNRLNPILTLSMIDITEAVKETGKYHINPQGTTIIYLDDVGTEEASVKHYGTNNLWFKNFIETVYLRAKCYNHLIITTNLNFKGIEDQYGYRVASRMREMFNVLDLPGKDMRDKKT